MNYIKLIWRYGLIDLYKMDKFITSMLSNYSNIYKLQENQQAFSSVPEMLKAMGGNEMYGYTQVTARQALEKIGLKPLLIDELVTAVMRINYGQDATLNGFAGEDINLKGKGQCVVPEKLHTHPMEGHWEFLGGGGLKSYIFRSSV